VTAGTIGVCSGELTRYADFPIALMHTQTPPGTKLYWAKGVNVVENMNAMVRAMEGDWLWMIGDDHVFDFDILARLLEHNVDVVVPLCLKRTPPYDPVVYSHQNDRGEYVGSMDLPEHGLVEVYASGTAGMLVRRRVFEKLGDPVFSTGPHGLNEDLTFCARLRDAGVKIWCDVDAPLGHIGPISVWPKFEDGEWRIALHLGPGQVWSLRRFVKPEAELAGAPA
jgi:hypothetical protein